MVVNIYYFRLKFTVYIKDGSVICSLSSLYQLEILVSLERSRSRHLMYTAPNRLFSFSTSWSHTVTWRVFNLRESAEILYSICEQQT